MRLRRTRIAVALSLAPLLAIASRAEEKEQDQDRIGKLEQKIADLEEQLDLVRKSTDDVLWFLRLQDVADVDKVTIVGPPDPNAEERYGIKNEQHPLKIYCYGFVPKKLDRSRRHRAIVLPHGGVHGDFTTYYLHIVREMLDHGYVVVAPEYRGSTGYGRDHYEAIDYGGLEVEDVVACRDWAVAELPVDGSRVAIVGWSHGGLIALMAAFDHPDKWKAAYAGVPVSDLLTRFGYHEESYQELFSADFHVGKKAVEDVAEYRRRSPVWNVSKLQIPLFVTSTTNDRDVDVVEVEQLVNALKAAGKDFEYKIYQDAPGGHSFERIDTPVARESRARMYAWLEKQLSR